MGWNGVRRTAAPAALAAVVALVLAAPPSAGAGPRAGTGTVTAAASAGAVAAARQDPSPATPPPPRLPRDFRGKGKWIVRDLDITVPFTWEGRNGDSQMTAGGPQYPIWFTNLIYHGTLYTLTYKWPGLNEHPCSTIPGFSLEDLNRGFEGARFVGRETLRRTPQRHVNHWRVGVVLPQLPPGNYPRLPLALGDIYVDENDRGTFWQVLQFGVQNLYDPELDEWLVMDTFEHRPGTVTLPARCEPPR
ncbi:hypothetical protein [Streptomyces erythrochromogenes]|uniref:hypothetical protein n=1 Tax=Streptomyces erythrochromogenes TaxID=285574 RepID=UPI003862F587|nr:hypothetical protein OG364_01260 [Streptomyces erythrochromogenes]WST98305.1 hypothetical protein OG364_40280 [Streptomyces erythrochromogenes]